jgi:pantetheine-phosphate adenylyltransferase/dephospho-CoA kinase
MIKAIYAFSGDPITYGHIDIIKRAANIFDKVIVGIGVNPEKKYTFSLEERTDMAKRSLVNLSNVEVTSFRGLLVDFAYENDISVIIKGIRNQEDFNYEMMLDQFNHSQKMGIETFFLPARQELTHISSSMVKAMQQEQGLVHEYVPLYVKQKLEEKISGQFLVGVTGELGSGKSYVSDKLVNMGKNNNIQVFKIELDDIGHDILDKYTEPIYEKIRTEIVNNFGITILKKDGFIDRKKLGEIVFQDYNKLKKLNELMHQPIVARLRKEIYGKKGIILLNAALFAETSMTYLCNNNLILVYSDKETQEKRLLERGLTHDQIERRIKSQYNTAEKKKTLLEKIKSDSHGNLILFENHDNVSDVNLEKLFNDLLNTFGILGTNPA